MLASALALVGSALFSLQAGGSPLPVYHPQHLQPVAWPPNSPTPGFHSNDVTYATLVLSGEKFGVLRGAWAWGTGIVEERFTLMMYRPGWDLDSLYSKPDSGPRRLWNGLSFRGEWADEATGDPRKGHFTVSGCLFVADDSLIALGIYPDSSSAAKDYVSQHMPDKAGFYRWDTPTTQFVKVAKSGSDFEGPCLRQAQAEGRGLDAS
jgi:hypothetical protein